MGRTRSPSFSGLNLVFLGPPGSGKDTQAEQLAESYSIAHISTGELLREEVARGSFAGRQARESMEKGELVGDRLMAGLVLQRLDREDCARGFLLNGYPRTAEQSGLLDGILAELGRVIERVVLFEVSDEALVERAALRGADADAMRRKLAAYREHIAPVAEVYRARGQLLVLDGSRSVDDVAMDLHHAIGTSVVA